MDYNYMSFGDRKRVRNIDGTPPFQYSVPQISASSKLVIELALEKPTWKKYLPFDEVTINNDGGTKINVTVNQMTDRALYLPDGTGKTFRGSVGIWTIEIENLSTTTATTANQIRLEFARTGMVSDKLSKKVATAPILRLIGL